ncbi:uncharacterized protein N7482_000177 [Penicillium canariense]|uniref:Uncharacterized protein n=1 Tax=Penicillium canariense TaxID=189055 RepID=A0A9W9IBD4_9EURO|nr:uncharacterized protein N7482_000177 [Penicillium canariense]KAJ5174300.1 hypothetical protein N7482_000177 [Penicillium canariense]
MEHLACADPATSFVHAYPRLVETGLMREFGVITRTAVSALLVLGRPWMVPLDESGKRHLYAATSPWFPHDPPAMWRMRHRVPMPLRAVVHIWSDNGKRKPLQELRQNDAGKLVWQHTMGVLESICGKRSGY